MAQLKDVRKQLGVNQSEIARYLGVSTTMVSFYENGQAIPDLENISSLERSFDEHLEFEDIITEEDKPRVIEALTSLMRYYPISAVLAYANNLCHCGREEGNPAEIIVNFAQHAPLYEPEILPDLDVQSELRRTKHN